MVESFPSIGSNYSEAVECFKAHFGHEDLPVEFYVKELLKLTLVINSKKDSESLFPPCLTEGFRNTGWRLLTSMQPCCSSW